MRTSSKSIISEIKNSGIFKDVQHITHLGEGGFSNCYLLRTKTKPYVLKFRRDKETWRLEREAKLLSIKQIANHHLAPTLYKFDKSCKKFKYPYLLEEFVQGTNPIKSKITPQFIKTMAREYKALHKVTAKKTEKDDMQRINSISIWAKEHFENFKKQQNKLNKPAKQELTIIYEKLLKICTENDNILKRNIYNFVQCDPSKENIFITKNGTIKLIDWDFAGYHIFERDLLLFVDTYNLNKPQEKTFLKHYGVSPTSAFMKKFNILKLLFFTGDINWLLSERTTSNKKLKNIIKKCMGILSKLDK